LAVIVDLEPEAIFVGIPALRAEAFERHCKSPRVSFLVS
jgi:hypothetical protein